jgi:hypothetical protein
LIFNRLPANNEAMRLLCTIGVFCLLAAGCTSYRYEIAAPDGSSKVVSKDADLVIPAPPGEVRVRQVDSYCVVMIENPTTRPVTLDGGESTLVDPGGQARAVATQLVPPGAFTKIVLPPLRQVQPRGPEFRIGFGMQVLAPASTDEPVVARYMQYAGPVEYWEWSGEGSVRLILGLRQDDQLVHHQFLIQRFRK